MLKQPTSLALLHSHTIAMSFANREVPHAVVHSHSCLHSLSLFSASFRSWGSRSCPQFLIHNPKFLILIKELFSPVRKIFFSYWENDFLRAFQSHNKGTTSAGGNHTIPYDFTCYLAARAFWRLAQMKRCEPYLA